MFKYGVVGNIETKKINIMGHTYNLNKQQRTDLIKKCKDADYMPRHKDAGKIIGNVQIMFNGLKIVKDCYYGDLITPMIEYHKGVHEPQEEKCFYEILKHIKEGSVMMELGSYWAYYSMWFNVEIKNAKNIMIDSDPACLNVGKENFKLNNLEGIFIHGRIPQFNIIKYMDDNNIDNVAILHSDIQSSELSLIQNIQNDLHRFDYFFIGTHTDEIHYSILNTFKNKGLKILCEFSMVESYQCDGLIVATNVEDAEIIEISKTNIKYWDY